MLGLGLGLRATRLNYLCCRCYIIPLIPVDLQTLEKLGEKNRPNLLRNSTSLSCCYTKQQAAMSSSHGTYYYEYQLQQDNAILPHDHPTNIPGESVFFKFKINYILKKRPIPGQDDGEEILDSICRNFYSPWYFVTDPQNNLDSWLRYHGLRYDDVREGLHHQITDFANQMKADPSNAGRRSFPVLVCIQVYTIQQEDETIDAAKDRAIVVETSGGINYERNLLIQPTATPVSAKPEYLEKVKVKVDDPEQGECCICLNKPCVGEEISILPCSHAYHSKCISDWLVKNKPCPLCRKPVHWN